MLVLYRTLREPLEEYLPLDFRCEMGIHGFETLMSLAHVDLRKKEFASIPSRRDWAPLGRFAVAHRERSEGSIYSALRDEYAISGEEWEPIKSGLLEQQTSLGGTATVSTVNHNFGVIDDMISRAGYW